MQNFVGIGSGIIGTFGVTVIGMLSGYLRFFGALTTQ